MATTIAKYLEKCNEVYEAKPTYVHGASDLKECDCIGMDKYAFRQCNVSFSTTGTNWSFRNQVENIRAISSASDLQVGDVVFKAYEQGESGYDLPAKYQPGGSGYNGDLRDYYHIGTVKSVDPLQIIHMTSPTAKMDTTLNKKGWDFAASWKKEYISDSPDPGPTPPGPEPTPPEPQTAKVTAPTGSTVNMRKGPGKNYALVERVPIGSIVSVLEKGDEWSKIAYCDSYGATWYGWMMNDFLIFYTGTTTYTVHIPFLTKDKAEALVRAYPGSWMTEDSASVG